MVNTYAVQSGGCRFESLWGFGFFLKGAHYEVDYSGKNTYLAGLQCTLTSSCAQRKQNSIKLEKWKKIQFETVTSHGRISSDEEEDSAQSTPIKVLPLNMIRALNMSAESTKATQGSEKVMMHQPLLSTPKRPQAILE